MGESGDRGFGGLGDQEAKASPPHHPCSTQEAVVKSAGQASELLNSPLAWGKYFKKSAGTILSSLSIIKFFREGVLQNKKP